MSNLEKGFMDEINFVIESMANDEYCENKDKVIELTDEDIRDIVDDLIYDNSLSECLNSCIEYYINKRIGEKL